MTKNKIILMLAMGLLFSPFMSVKAETATPTEIAGLKAKLMKETEVIKKDLEAKKLEIQNKIAERKDVVKKRLEVKAQERIKITLDRIYNKLNIQLNKLEAVDVKISTKITALEKEGKDVIAVRAQYDIAKQALDKAKGELSATRMVGSEEITKETSKEALRETVKTAEDTIRAIGAEYRKVLPLLINI